MLRTMRLSGLRFRFPSGSWTGGCFSGVELGLVIGRTVGQDALMSDTTKPSSLLADEQPNAVLATDEQHAAQMRALHQSHAQRL